MRQEIVILFSSTAWDFGSSQAPKNNNKIVKTKSEVRLLAVQRRGV